MEEEINYSTIIFQNRNQESREKEEASTVYAVVQHKGAAATATNGEAAARSHFPVSSVCLGILCVLLVTSISVIIIISVSMGNQKANLKNLEAEIQQLTKEKSVLQNETETEMERLITERNILKKETETLSTEKNILKSEMAKNANT